MKYYFLIILVTTIQNSYALYRCNAPNALCSSGQEQITFEMVLDQYLRYQPQHHACKNTDAALDTDLVHGIRTLNPDLVAETINKKKLRSCPTPLHPEGNYIHLQGISAQIIAAVQLELVTKNREPEDYIQAARDIVTIVSGGHAEYLIQRWNQRKYRSNS